MPRPRLTQPALKLLRVFVQNPRERLSGADIAKATKLGSGTLYPILARFEVAGWLGSDWEEGDASELGRPLRRLYKLTGLGQREANAALNELQVGTGAPAWST